MTVAPKLVKVGECLYRNSSSGTYIARVKRKGKEFKQSLKTKDRKLAERRLRDYRAQVGNLSGSAADRRVRFELIAQKWMRAHSIGLKTSSAKRNECCLGQLQPHFGFRAISEIAPLHCEEWAAERSGQVSGSSFNKELEVLKAVFELALREGLILNNPARDLKRRKLGKKEIVIPTREEYSRLVETLQSFDRRAEEAVYLVQLLALSGTRLGEATEMLWRHVDFGRRQFTVVGGHEGPKNRQTRVVPLFRSLKPFLEELRDRKGWHPKQQIVGIDSAKSAMESACNKAGLPHFTHHTLRHYFVSNAIEAGVDFKTISDWIGHRDGGVLVAKTYGHLRQVHSEQMAERL